MNTLESRSLRDYVALFSQYRWRALACLVAAVALAAVYLWLAPRKYESEAKLFVRVGRENASLDPTVTRGETIALTATREEEINSILEHIRSRSILEQTLAVYDPSSSQLTPEDRELALRRLQSAIDISSPRASTVVTLRCRGASPELAQKIAATLVKVYLDDHMRIYRASGSYEFFRAQSELLKGQLEAAQEALRDAKNKAGMASIEGRRTAIENQISSLESQIQQVGAQAAAAAEKLKTLEGSVQSLPEPLLRQMLAGVPHDGLAAMQEQLFQLRIREQEALAKYTPEHPLAIAIHQQVQEVEEALKKQSPERKELIVALTAAASADLAFLTAQKEKLQVQLDQLTGQLAVLNEAELLIEKRTRDVEQLETQYLAYSERREEARMDQALQSDRITNVSTLQPATFVPRPVRPQKMVVLFLGLVGGLLGAVFVVAISDQCAGSRDDSKRTPATEAAGGPFVVVRTQHAPSAAHEGNGRPIAPETKPADV